MLTLLVEFRGRGVPMDKSPGFAISTATGPITAFPGTAPAPGPGETSGEKLGEASMSTVVYANEGQFWEAGEIAFPGLDGSLIVDTVTPGVVHQRPDGTSYGSITWRVVSGAGGLAGAQGIVTGNFNGDATGGFHDHQLYNLLIP